MLLNYLDSMTLSWPTSQAIATHAGVPLRRASGILYGSDQWMQDTMEIGYSRMPGRQYNVVLSCGANTPGLDPYPHDEVLAPAVGYTEVPTSTTENTFDSHGNLEVSPPVRVGGSEYKLGRIYHGRGQPGDEFNDDVKRFLEAQLVPKTFRGRHGMARGRARR